MISLVIPVYKNAENIPSLLTALEDLRGKLAEELEVVFVVDGSPDDSALQLRRGLDRGGGGGSGGGCSLKAQLILLSRNFGAFAAIRAGLEAARGDRLAVLAADLQEPPELIVAFQERLASGSCDIVLGVRRSRADPWLSRLASATFWAVYRRWVQQDIPKGGVDVFGCTRAVRDEILALQEGNSSLVGLLFWVGFRRVLVPYDRRARALGRSAWTLTKKVRYLADSIFNFTDLPVRLLFRIGFLGTACSILASVVILAAKLSGRIPIPGYTATVLIVVFFGALNCLGLGIIGGYVWRTLENTKGRPNFLVASRTTFEGDPTHELLQPSASDR